MVLFLFLFMSFMNYKVAGSQLEAGWDDDIGFVFFYWIYVTGF